jgi:hypothetical protein
VVQQWQVEPKDLSSPMLIVTGHAPGSNGSGNDFVDD